VILIPAFRYLLAPLWRKGDKLDFVDVGPLQDIPIGEWKLLSLELTHTDGWRKTQTRHAIWVRRQSAQDTDITVLSSICPHLGCPINWHPDRSQFVCPCHTGVFDEKDQHVVSGPPPRKMDALQSEVRSGHLWVRWQDFKIGVRDQIAVNV
jgi:Rieske Fe-S protein